MRILKKNRESFYIYGKHAVVAALKNEKRKILNFYATLDSFSAITKLVKINDNIKVNIVTEEDINFTLKDKKVHQNLILEVLPLNKKNLDQIINENKNQDKTCFVILDQVTDPHNIGSVLRTAAAFSINALIIQKINSPEETGVIAKVASGTLEQIPIITVANICNTMDKLKENGYWCLGLDAYAKNTIEKIKEYNKVVLIIGSEGKGIRNLIKNNCDLTVKIPMTKDVESLNVSNAAAIAFYNFFS